MYLFLVTVLGKKGIQSAAVAAELFFILLIFQLVCVCELESERSRRMGGRKREGGLERNLKACAKMDEPRCERKSS